ncbi:MICOS complex subunit MIC27 isoform X1 [Dermacentor andersoni]|uniref:MICOS complex subunit MIC27 isoform X1 n=1 Tax=Dermacentor andersoni TaxID=34620 RepID=UPI003B3BB0CB
MDVAPKVHAEAAAPAEEKKPACRPCCRGKKLKKPSELPLYSCPSENVEYELVEEPPGQVENAVHYVRTSLSPYYSAVESASERVGDLYTTAIEHSKSSYEYVTREENMVSRAMAISLGGLTGIVLGARGGIFKKLIYGSVGATAAAAACYPKEARKFSQDYLVVARDQAAAAVKQVTGHDLNDLFSKVQLPKLPDFSAKTIDQVGQQVSDIQYYGFRLADPESKSS